MDLLKRLMRRLVPPLFTIRLIDGDARLELGKASPGFVRDCREVARASHIRRGWIWGHGSGTNISLEFSKDIREGDRQRFRNVAGVNR